MLWLSTLFEFIGTHFPSSLVGVIGGFLTGLLAEPIKGRMSSKRRKNEITHLLYQEVATVYLGIELAKLGADRGKIPTPLSAEESLQFLAFDVVYEKELSIIAELREARVFKSFRDRVRLALADASTLEAARKAVTPLLDAKYSIEGAIKVGIIHRREFDTALSNAQRLNWQARKGDLYTVDIGWGALREEWLPQSADMKVALLEKSFPLVGGLGAVVSFHPSPRPQLALPAAKFLRHVWNASRRKSDLREASNDPLPARSLKCTCIADGKHIECQIFGRNRSVLERGRRCEVGMIPDNSSRSVAEVLRPQMKVVVKVEGVEIGVGEILDRQGLLPEEGTHHDEQGAVSANEPDEPVSPTFAGE